MTFYNATEKVEIFYTIVILPNSDVGAGGFRCEDAADEPAPFKLLWSKNNNEEVFDSQYAMCSLSSWSCNEASFCYASAFEQVTNCYKNSK